MTTPLGWALLHLSAIKNMSHGSVWWRNFLNWWSSSQVALAFVKLTKTTQHKCQVLLDSCTILLSSRLKYYYRGRIENLQEPEVVYTCSETIICGHDSTIVHLNSQRTLKIPKWMTERLLKFYFNWGYVGIWWLSQEESVFPHGWSTWEATHSGQSYTYAHWDSTKWLGGFKKCRGYQKR